MSEQTTPPPIVDEFTARFEKMVQSLTPERKAQMARDAEEDKRRRKLTEIDNIREGWNAPRRHVECSPIKDGPWGAQLEKLKAMMNPSTGRIVGLVGGRGNGKTQMAVEIMRERTERLQRAKFTSAVEFFIRIKATYKPDSDSDEMEVLKTFRQPSLLVIDEIGKRGSTEWENVMLFELLNRRYNDLSDTILIDNRERKEFIESIGPSLASRMNEGGGIIEANWPSFREK